MGHDEAHLGVESAAHSLELIALSLHHDGSSTLGEGGAELPDGGVVWVGDELSFHVEVVSSVDDGAINTIGA